MLPHLLRTEEDRNRMSEPGLYNGKRKKHPSKTKYRPREMDPKFHQSNDNLTLGSQKQNRCKVNTSPFYLLSTNGFSTEDDSRPGHDQVCCLIDNNEKCQRQAGNASYSKRIQNQARKLKLIRDEMSPHIYICDYHKTQIQNIRTKRKRKDSEDDLGYHDGEEETVEIDFYQMPVNTLRRYKRHYKLPTRPGLSKAQLADAVASHFKTIAVMEKETLQMFFYTTKTKKFDSKDGAT